MEYGVTVQADSVEALDELVTAMEKWFETFGATVLQRAREDEEFSAHYVVRTTKELASRMLKAELPGKIEIEPLD